MSENDNSSIFVQIIIFVLAFGFALALVGPVLFGVIDASTTIDTFEDCTVLTETSCEDVTIESEQAAISEVQRTLFEIEQIDFESLVYAVTVPTDWQKEYVVLEYTIYTEGGQLLEQSRTVIPANSEISESGQIELTEEEAELGDEITIEIVGGSDGPWASDYAE